MTGRTSLHLLQAVLIFGIALSCVCPARAGGIVSQSQEREADSAEFLFKNPLDGLNLISEGQALMMRRSPQAIIEALGKFKEGFARCQKNDNKMGMGAARLWEGIAYDSLGKKPEALNAFLDAARYLEELASAF